jgi:hypothetical protein
VPTWPSPVLSSGFTYVSDTAPTAPEEGETWYDTSTSEAKAYDGVSWLKLTVTDHAELGSVSAGQHRSDANIQSVVDGQVDADTVDGQHASDLGSAASVNTVTYTNALSCSNAGDTDTAYVFGFLESLEWSVSTWGPYGVDGKLTVSGQFDTVYSNRMDASNTVSKSFNSVPISRISLSQLSDDRGSCSLNSITITHVEP